MAYLTQFSNSVPVIKFPIDQSLMTIGQHIDMDICVPEEGIAEKHAEIEVFQRAQSYHFVVKAIAAEETTIQLNGDTVSQAELQDGDWLLIGDIEFQFTNDGVNEIKDESVIPFNMAATETVQVQVVEEPEEEVPSIKTAQLLRENRFSRRLNRF